MKHNWKKSTLAFLLTLLMVTGLFAALGGSAWAYDGNPYASLVGKTTTVTFNDIEWYIIADNSKAENEGTVTLLAKKPIGSSTFHDGGASQDSKFMAYDISTVKEYLDRQTAEGGGFARVAYAIAPTDLDDVSVTGAKLYLLSYTEATVLNQNIKKTTIASGAEKNYWWLRTPERTGYYPAAAKRVDEYGYDGGSSYVGWRLGVRPALRLDLSKVTYNTTSRRFVVAPLEYSVTLSGGANATADPATGTSQTGLTGAMTTVTYTANSGYMFPETSDYYTTTSGVTVARTSNTKVTVSGTPTANVTITVPDAVVDDTGAPVPYLAWDYTNKTMVEKTGDEACKDYTEVTGSTTTWSGPNGVTWYVVKKNVTISSRITVSGNVSLILCNGAKLTASRGITVADGGNILNIYAQSTDENTMGELIATGRVHESYQSTVFNGDAGIGGSEGNAGIITINGGKITATGGYRYSPGGGAGIGGGCKGNGGTITINGGIITANGMEGGAGIGGGTRDSDSGGDGGIITINGGVVVAKAIGSSNPRGAGIGGGFGGGSGGTITINGGSVTAASGTWGAGIGGGQNGNGGQITINDGTVEATGGEGGAGIGGGGSSGSGGIININGGTVDAFGKRTPSSDNKASGAGIGGGNEGTGGTITISGGTVTAAADGGGAGIGGGTKGNGGTVFISGGTVTATGGEAAAGIGGGRTAAGANVTITGGSVKALGGTSTPGIPPAVAIGRGMKNWVEQDLPDNRLNVGQGLYVYGGETEATKAYIVPDVQGDYTRTQYMEVNDTVPPGYTITVDSSVTHGSVTPSATVAPEGTAIALTVAPETGYTLTEITAVWGDSQTKLTLTKDSANENKYTFTMPAGNVTVNAKFSKPTITGADLALNGSLDFRFYVDIPAGIDTTGANMSFSIGGRSARRTEVAFDKATEINGKYVFSFPVYSIEMAEPVTATFRYGTDGTVEKVYSVKEYLDTFKSGNAAYNLAIATRNYGHYMQPYLANLHGFTIGTDYTAMPAGSEITALESLPGFERTWNLSESLPNGYNDAVLNAVGYYDSFNESTTLSVLVNLKTSPSTVTATVDGKAATVENLSDNIYRIQISNIAANNLGTPYHVVFSADNAVFCDMNVSAMTYVGTVLPKAAERAKTGEAEALTAFYYYYAAAKAYAGN